MIVDVEVDDVVQPRKVKEINVGHRDLPEDLLGLPLNPDAFGREGKWKGGGGRKRVSKCRRIIPFGNGGLSGLCGEANRPPLRLLPPRGTHHPLTPFIPFSILSKICLRLNLILLHRPKGRILL